MPRSSSDTHLRFSVSTRSLFSASHNLKLKKVFEYSQKNPRTWWNHKNEPEGLHGTLFTCTIWNQNQFFRKVSQPYSLCQKKRTFNPEFFVAPLGKGGENSHGQLCKWEFYTIDYVNFWPPAARGGAQKNSGSNVRFFWHRLYITFGYKAFYWSVHYEIHLPICPSPLPVLQVWQ